MTYATIVYQVLEIILLDYGTPGMAGRLSLCCKEIYEIVINHSFIWKFFSKQKLMLKKNNTRYDVVEKLKHNKRCRECGAKNAYKTLCSNRNLIYLCCNCTSDYNGYNRLLSRKEINEFPGWRPKVRLLKTLVVAKKSKNGKYLYWEHEFKNLCNQTIKKNEKRVLPF